MRSPTLIAVFGPTASGKTALAEAFADHLGAQLINSDAFQSYRGLDIGTAKPENRQRYALLDIKEPADEYGAGEFVQRAADLLDHLFELRQSAVIVGGTCFYMRALLEEYASMSAPPDPEVRAALKAEFDSHGLSCLADRLTQQAPLVATKTDLANPVRVIRALEKLESLHLPPRKLPAYRRIKLGLYRERADILLRVRQRTHEMVQNGWIQEVENLREAGVQRHDPGMRAIGYRRIWDFLDSGGELATIQGEIEQETVQYAKRQLTWMRSEPNLEPVVTREGYSFVDLITRLDLV